MTDVYINGMPAGLVNPGLQSQSRVATWPTAAAQLMAAPKLQSKSARPASPVSSGSTGLFSNKRRKLGPSDAFLGLAAGTTPWQASQPAVHSAHVPTEQVGEPGSNTSNADVASDADSDPNVAVASAPQHHNVASSLAQAVLGSRHFTDDNVSTAAPDLLASTEQLATDPDQSADAQCGSGYSDESPGNDSTCSDASIPFRPIAHLFQKAKGKRCIGPSPLPQFDPEQESKLDHLKTGNWVWWREESTWTFAKVRVHSCPWYIVVAFMNVTL